MEDKGNSSIKTGNITADEEVAKRTVYTPITFDKFIRWTLAVLGVVVVFLIVNYLSDVLLPFFIDNETLKPVFLQQVFQP